MAWEATFASTRGNAREAPIPAVRDSLIQPRESTSTRPFVSVGEAGGLCRVPHIWLGGRRSLYDAMGPDYTLLRLDPGANVVGIVAAAAQRALPLAVLDVRSRHVLPLYGRSPVLVRPDQHVAWRGDEEPADPLGLVDLVRGAALTWVAKSA